MNYYDEIKEKLIKSEVYDKSKDYAKDKHKVNVYFETGKLLSLAGKEYGKNIIKQYSEKLEVEVNKKYNERNLRYMRKFYEIFAPIKWNPVGSKLSWSHFRELLVVKDVNAIMYYIDVCEKKNLSKRQLYELIKSKEYDRLSDNVKRKLTNKNDLKVEDLIPNPIVIKNSYLNEQITEYALKESILNNLDDFLKQLGYGFTYVGNEYKLKIGNNYNYIDILLYNVKHKCYVVVELKTTELKKEHIGQIMIYMNYIDKNVKSVEENSTVGVIICKKNNKYIIDFCSNRKIFARAYELV